jgi:acyl-CoA dehydrogenase
MPHIRQIISSAFARLMAMRLYAFRALDYLQSASEQDRRFLLFNAVQKAKVSTEGVKVMALLSECIGARGFEADTYFESALREAPMIPSLEGSTHINLRLCFQFVEGYFNSSDPTPQAPPSLLLGEAEPYENPYWLASGERNPKTVAFADFGSAYEPLIELPNVAIFRKQVQAFARFAAVWTSSERDADMAVTIAAGKCLATIVYGQLVAENCQKAAVAASLTSLIFGELIEDLTADALRLSARLAPKSQSRSLLHRVVRIPRTSVADCEAAFGIIDSRYR